MLESLFNIIANFFPCEFCKTFKDTFFSEQLRWLLLIILNYVILYQIRPAYPLPKRITSTLYEFS